MFVFYYIYFICLVCIWWLLKELSVLYELKVLFGFDDLILCMSDFEWVYFFGWVLVIEDGSL